jgi:soluble lytic murein transglycosylase-like protein
MRRGAIALALVIAPAVARAGDIGDALRFASPMMSEEDITQNLEQFIDDNPDEALSILVGLKPGRPNEQYEDPPFRDLGGDRLSFLELEQVIQAAAKATNLPVALIDAVIRTESGYRPNAVSRTGAIGLMQLMPDTARELGVQNAYDPYQNVMGGARYLRKMLDRFGTLRLAVAAYNAGPGSVEKHGGVPPFAETKQYVRTVLSRYERSRLGGVD